MTTLSVPRRTALEPGREGDGSSSTRQKQRWEVAGLAGRGVRPLPGGTGGSDGGQPARHSTALAAEGFQHQLACGAGRCGGRVPLSDAS